MSLPKLLKEAKNRKELCWVQKPNAKIRAWLCKDCESQLWVPVDKVKEILGLPEEKEKTQK